MIISILEQSAAFLPFTLGIYISFCILKKADLTVDGSFVLGAAITAKLTILQMPLILVLVLSAVGGAGAGVITALLQYKGRISSLIAGVVVLFILQSINLIYMGRPNLNLLEVKTLTSYFSPLISIGFVSLIILVLTITFLYTKNGLYLRAFGNNPHLIAQLGQKREKYRILGFAISNALVALSGSLNAQLNGYADISMGTGLVVIGIVTVLLGQQLQNLFPQLNKSQTRQVISSVCGTIFYFVLIYILSSIGIPALYLKLLIGLTLGMLLIFQSQQSKNIKLSELTT